MPKLCNFLMLLYIATNFLQRCRLRFFNKPNFEKWRKFSWESWKFFALNRQLIHWGVWNLHMPVVFLGIQTHRQINRLNFIQKCLSGQFHISSRLLEKNRERCSLHSYSHILTLARLQIVAAFFSRTLFLNKYCLEFHYQKFPKQVWNFSKWFQKLPIVDFALEPW